MTLKEKVLNAIAQQPDRTLEELIDATGEPTLSHVFMTTLAADGVISQWRPRPTSPTQGTDRNWQRTYTTRARLMKDSQ